MTAPPVPATDETPRAWIGCLAHYNAGYLIGDWFDAVGADDGTLAGVHKGSGKGVAASATSEPRSATPRPATT